VTDAPGTTTRSFIRAAETLLVIAAIALLFALVSRTTADPDLWGHVRFGLDILDARELATEDPYSFTQDRPWVNHEWLSELQMGLAYAALGVMGLTLLKGVLTMATLLLVWGALRGVDLAPRFVVTAIGAVGMAQVAQTLRPQLWSFLFIAVLCRLLVSPVGTRRWWLPVLFAVWANTHGGWIVGLGILGAWVAAESLTDRARMRQGTLVLACSVLATLATPYGWGLWAFLVETVRMTRPMIEEWAPLWAFGPTRWLPWVVTLGVAIWAARAGLPARWARLAVLAVLAYVSARVARVSPFFVEAALIFLAPAFAGRWPGRATGRAVVRSTQDALVAGALTVALLVGTVRVGAASLGCIAVDGDRMPEPGPVEMLQAGEPGRLVTFFNWGEYALWHLAPRLRVSMDGRRETVYSEARIAEHDGIVYGEPAGLAMLAVWQAEYAWLPAGSTAARLELERAGYRIEFDSAASFVAVRGDLPALPVASDAPPGRRCFPG
jgi:hypothetical protein